MTYMDQSPAYSTPQIQHTPHLKSLTTLIQSYYVQHLSFPEPSLHTLLHVMAKKRLTHPPCCYRTLRPICAGRRIRTGGGVRAPYQQGI
jgi:hypothetical protein